MHMSPHMVRLAFGGMHLEHTKADMVREVYYVHKGEVIGYVVRRVKKGTAVFVSSNGTPVLLQICANPLRPASAGAVASAGPVADYSPTEAVPELSKSQLASQYALRDIMPDTSLGSTEVVPPPLLESETAVAPPSFHVGGLGASVLPSPHVGGGGLFGVLGGLAGLGLLAAALGSHSSGAAFLPPPVIGGVTTPGGPGTVATVPPVVTVPPGATVPPVVVAPGPIGSPEVPIGTVPSPGTPVPPPAGPTPEAPVVVAVPEPTSLALLAASCGGVGTWVWLNRGRRRKRQARAR